MAYSLFMGDSLDEKVLEVESDLLVHNAEYGGLIQRCDDLHSQIKQNLPDGCKLLIGEYEKAHFLQQGMVVEQAYVKGLQDALLQLQ